LRLRSRFFNLEKMNKMPCPAPENDYLVVHTELLRNSFQALTGQPLIDDALSPTDAARALFEAPFVLLSHNTEADPILTYGNLRAMEVFELTWEELTVMPSRLTAESPNRTERARLLQQVTEHGFINNYSGVRASKTGRRFLIEKATVWNLIGPSATLGGQAAAFSHWRYTR